MSTTPHKASAEQWASIEQLASTCIYDLVILELRARVEALEATQHAHVNLSHLSDAEREAAMNELRAASAEARPATNEPTDRELRELFWYRPKGLETEAAALRRVYQAGMAAAVQSSAQQEISAMTNCHLFGPAPSPYGSWSEWFETEGSKGVIHGIRMEALPVRSSAQQEIADAEAFGLTSTLSSLVDRSAPAPASSLVERVAGAIADAGWDTDSYDPEARAAIAAQSIWDAFNAAAESVGTFNDYGYAIAAALRAAADQVVPHARQPELHGSRTCSTAWQRWDERCEVRFKLLIIAAELEDA